MKYGIYCHIPFCRKKCDYCSFYSIPLESENNSSVLIDAYAERLLKEMKDRLRFLHGNPADTVFFGGGTPSLLAPENIHRILSVVREEMELEPDAEISLEINPEDCTRGKLAGFRDAGVNRFVLGVQTLSKKCHGMIGRSAPPVAMGTMELFFGIKDATHCIDLMSGIPAQELSDLGDDLAALGRFRPEHVSVYSLSIEKGTPLYDRLDPGLEFDNLQRIIFEEMITQLKILGYHRYEISNFALDGFECRHNMKYWTFAPYIGFGPASHSFVDGERCFNRMQVSEYLSSEKEALIHDVRSENSKLVEYFMTGLRLINGISLNEIECTLRREVPGPVIERINSLQEKSLVEIKNSGDDRIIRLSGAGLFFADSVIYQVVEDLL